MSDPRPLTHAALIVAAGRGTRAGGEIPKQWQPLGGRRVIDWTLDAFRASPHISRIVVVLHPDDMGRLTDADLLTVAGGATRAASVRAGLEALAAKPTDCVLIHDAARATIPDSVIADMCRMLEEHDAVAPGVAISDALWTTDSPESREVAGTADRSRLWRAQTPQCFRFETILAAHRAQEDDAADDVEVARRAGIPVVIGPGHPDNIKITTREDFARAERILKERTGGMDIRLGNGFDVHRFGPGDHVTLCGVDIPFDRGLQGHSDADVAMHTVTDAIYGALAEGDIGRHFPPSDPQWKGAASRIFLEHAVELAAKRGFAIGNVDCTIICEFPKIGPHAAAMQAEMGRIMGLDAARISIKATTSERLGFTGRGEGIAAIATVTLIAT
ncbi:bifunctional 2-C-methyl-D-erythritol 4-phosphate cytidylyltransferase/2-C-methyl-D-erythritol 2,4-cyclodiphosphate synthase [Alphaproteobacteria bacterium GH1-50]|uniref:Bifunctional enzyme IspD/IspF n=1 Tax=Kangsaoukella pontilimi TaxID=2691042 RepID=A0A7C9MCP9_9RHOB|nr:bifunctional 2-C-methyl-D-erythritol 4-phosphate cytidylyltransferase/2-C-methyl-D-erythritol 2,4-cyclodiphosphate synthase [Kangsaoukella pontilimi]MXQ07252.1 bifunctional 2-C-methyl-D-erythritol 4-phosphate cytidylyltransferase/2-C-methyl-D-erythritol 2,4-cyclodiphosphate synthase [Kangsaoukella pontilimi]